jgi:hypothetical protein
VWENPNETNQFDLCHAVLKPVADRGFLWSQRSGRWGHRWHRHRGQRLSPDHGFSVFVSGVEYETGSTVFTVDGRSGVTQNELKKGMVVFLEAMLIEDNVTKTIIKRTADRISYSDTVEGQVQAIEASGTTLTVLGQTILVTDSTIIDDSVPGRDLTRLVPNVDVVEVSGFVSGDGVLIATLIDRKAGAPDFELKGLVKNHDAGSETFQIGRLTVSYNGADISGMPNPTGTAWNGLPVHLLGSQC